MLHTPRPQLRPRVEAISEGVPDDLSGSDDPKIGVIVPCYNEIEMIVSTVTDLCGCLDRRAETYELIVVDDGSTDGSAALLAELAVQFRNLRIIEHETNLGYGAALKSGIRGARAELIAVIEKFLHILPDGFSFTTTITLALLTNSYRVRNVAINYGKRVGSSKIQPIRDTLRFAQLILRTGVYFAPLRVLFPLIVVLNLGFLASALYDVFVLENLTDKTVILLFFAVNTLMFALLADMIDKRSGR